MSTNSKSKSSKTSKTRPSSVISSKSVDSQSSFASIGMENSMKPPSEDTILRFRLMPEGQGTNVLNTYDQHLFDCVVFVIFCEKHKTIALTNTTDRNRAFSWLPFIPLNDVFTWNRTSQGGLAIILGQCDLGGEVDPTMATLPDYTVAWLNILRIQMPNCKFYSRLTQFVKLCVPSSSGTNGSGGSKSKCCQPTNRIRWLKLEDITARKVDKLWGDEVVSMCRSLTQDERSFLSELSLESCLPSDDTEEGKLLRQVEWSTERAHVLYEAFANHLYPAWLMTEHSFRCFMLKHAFLGKADKRFSRLFRAFAGGAEAISFEAFLVGLACMHPKANNQLDARAKFVFHFYDVDGKGVLTLAQLMQAMFDSNDYKTEETIVAKLKPLKCGTSLSFEQFCKLFRDRELFPSGERVLRLEKSVFDAKQGKSIWATQMSNKTTK